MQTKNEPVIPSACSDCSQVTDTRGNLGMLSDSEVLHALQKLSRREKEAVIVLIDGLLAADFGDKL